MEYMSVFSGIGGFELGFPASWQCVGFSEVDKYAISIYQSHFCRHTNYGDITTINPAALPDFDLLCGGFPCQSFSIAGKRGGFADTRGTLFFEIARIASDKRPRLLLLENVKGLLSHDFGLTFETIIETLDELGYDLQWQVLNSKNFGVPQNRERVFIVGNLRGTPRPEVFPIGTSNTIVPEQNAQGNDVAHTLQCGDKHRRSYVLEPEGTSSTLIVGGGVSALTESRTEESKQVRREMMRNGKDWSPRRGKILVPRRDNIGNCVTAVQGKEHLLFVPANTKKGFEIAREGDSINLSIPNSKTRRGRVGKGIAQTLDTGIQQYTLKGSRIRRLTPTECERLQGFPDGWTEGVSDSQRYKCLGNAVTVKVIEAIAERLA